MGRLWVPFPNVKDNRICGGLGGCIIHSDALRARAFRYLRFSQGARNMVSILKVLKMARARYPSRLGLVYPWSGILFPSGRHF